MTHDQSAEYVATHWADCWKVHEECHKLHHKRPHPNGGTWPYRLPLCECEQFDGVVSGPDT